MQTTHSPLIGALLLSLSGCVHSSPPALYQELWNFSDPAATEAAFTERLPTAQQTDLDTELQLLTQIARTQGLQSRFEEARETLAGVRDRLTEAPSTAHVRWFLERGRVNNSSGDKPGAAPDFNAAWRLAQALSLDGLAVDAAHMLAIALPDQALEWNQRALALAEGSADADARRWLGSLHNNLGWTHHDAGRFDEALLHFEAGLVARIEADQTGRVFTARWAVARSKRSLGRLEEALAEQLALQADRVAAEAPEDGYVSEELGELLLALDRSDESRAHFARAAELLSADAWMQQHEGERLARLRTLSQ